MNFVVKYIFKSVVGRWVTGAVVALLLGGAALTWHQFKSGLIDEGVTLCVQEINQATMIALEDALVDERRANAVLADQLKLAGQVNALALDRRQELETSLTALAKEMERQKNEDPEYREWSDTTLPSGVADRLREAARSQADNPD